MTFADQNAIPCVNWFNTPRRRPGTILPSWDSALVDKRGEPVAASGQRFDREPVADRKQQEGEQDARDQRAEHYRCKLTPAQRTHSPWLRPVRSKSRASGRESRDFADSGERPGRARGAGLGESANRRRSVLVCYANRTARQPG